MSDKKFARYCPPYHIIKRKFRYASVDGNVVGSIPYEQLLRLIKDILQMVFVDEEWYLQQYTDVVDGIKQGVVKDAKDHFVESGYFEGRLPFSIEVDDEWYLNQNPDVVLAIAEGKFVNATDHFISNGYNEGRLPHSLK